MFIFLVLAEARKRCGLSDCVWLIVSSCKYVQALHLLPGRIVLLLLLSCRAQVYFRANVLWLEKVADTSMVLWMLLAGFDVIVWLHTLGRKVVAPVDFDRILWNSLAIPFALAIKIYQFMMSGRITSSKTWIAALAAVQDGPSISRYFARVWDCHLPSGKLT
jgi:hypothetical protein